MKWIQHIRLIIGCLLLPTLAFSDPFTIWDDILSRYITHNRITGKITTGWLPHKKEIDSNLFDYRRLIRTDKDYKQFKQLLANLAAFDPETLKSKAEKLAFWINVYNIFTVNMVLTHYYLDDTRQKTLQSIRHISDLPPKKRVWEREAGIISNKSYSLDEIEHRILRKLGDPRIHMAIVCASLSCPDLRSESYVAKKLDAQLNDQVKRALQNTTKGAHYNAEDNTLTINKIFKWFTQDFGGKDGLRRFLATHYPDKDIGSKILSKTKVTFFRYFWDLNQPVSSLVASPE